MLEAVHTDLVFTISLKRSTQNLQLSTSSPADYPIYEDVVADLEGQARRIIAHCGLNWDPRCLAFHQTERPVLTASAAQVRQPIYNSAIGRSRVHERALGLLLAELSIAGSPIEIARFQQAAI